MGNRGFSKARKLKRHMIKELGVETFSVRLKRKLNEKSSRNLRTNETQTESDSKKEVGSGDSK